MLITTLTSSVKPVLNTAGIALASFAVFGVLGMQLLAGKMNYCSDSVIFRKEDCVGVSDDGDRRFWRRHALHFDDLWNSVSGMFILASQDSWPVHMWAGVDATSTRTGRIQNHNPPMVLFYLITILVAAYLIVNLFVGVFVDCYTTAAGEITKERKEKVGVAVLALVADSPEHEWRRMLFELVTTTWFDLGIALCILLNVITMALESWKQSIWQETWGELTDFFFS